MPPKRRMPKISAEEKAAITKEARELAKTLNEQIEGLKAQTGSKNYSPEERRRRNLTMQARRRKQRRGVAERQYCKGTNMAGKPCGLPPLIAETWDGPTDITGLYCLWHEPNVTRDERESFKLHGTANNPVPRRVTPGELAHHIIQGAPRHFLRPYLKALGLDMDEEGNLIQKGTGLKLYGYSRGGEVIRSPYPDLVGQVNITEKLLDRIYGKARQAVDLASTNTSVAIHIEMSVDRVDHVSKVLADAGALPLPNGNGNGHKDAIEGHAEDILDGDLEQ